MSRHNLLAFPLVIAGCHVRPESLLPTGAGSHAEPRSDHLAGSARTFLVLGEATSFVWPALLQELLDAHAGRRGLYRVDNGSAPVAGITAWTSGEEGSPLRGAIEEHVRRQPGELPRVPRTALCLVSLRGIGDERGPVKSEHDMVGAEMGADALERLALELQGAGVERVLFATPLYDGGAGLELGLERVAIQRLLERGHDFVAAGPDVFGASRRYFPDAYEPDRTRPNEFGAKLVAEEWYRWLAGPEARESVVEALYARDFDVEAIESAYAERIGASSP